ncbi:unnamed protein product [Closterium sp. NIES-54]
MFKHTSGSLQAPKALAEPAADAGEEVRTQFRTAHIAYKRRMVRDATATLAVRLHHSFDQRANFCQVPSALAKYSIVVRRYSPPPPAVLGCLVLPLTFPALSDLITVANEGGRSGAGRSGGGWHQELEPSVVGGGDAGGAGSGGAASGNARSPLVGGVGGTGAGGAGAGGAGAGGAESRVVSAACPCLIRPVVRLPDWVSGAYPVVLPLPPPSSLPAAPDPAFDLARAARPTIPCCLAALVTALAFLPAAACALVVELAGFAGTCCRAYLAGLVFASSCPPSIRGELALGCDVLEDRQFELEYLPYPLSIRTRYVAPGRHHPAHWRAARRVLRYLVRLASRT